ncbi:hypothetical protein [Bacteroides heparinolyticus]|uniref:hypothetical protein n=1 Tax=Prevotella heparinolytica TaxID=28113 RepID=UPI0035A187DC
MKSRTPIISTIRFRRWSRKSYAAFACIGRCVTIGYLRKDVADCSLAKQKVTGAATYTGCSMESVWKGVTKRKEDDYSTLPQIEAFLFFGMPENIILLNILSGIQGVNFIKTGKKYSFPQRSNSTGTVYRNLYDLCRSSILINRAFY